jgi:peptidoglycan/LPS O-acetylase OafA/YrhL
MNVLTRVPALDGLRGVAILAVIGIHMGLLRGGRAGVDIFFAISGYLITSILLMEYSRTGAIRLLDFYRRRAVRLLPALIVFLAVIALWSQFATLFVVSNVRALSAALFYFANLQITWLLPTKEHLGPLTHTWSLSIEEQFYLAWPLLLSIGLKLKASRTRLFGLTCGAALIILAWRLWLYRHGALADRIYFGTDTHSDGLMIGCALALMPEAIRIRLQNVLPMLWPLAGLILLWLVIAPFSQSARSWIGISAAAGCATVLIACIPISQLLRSLLSWAPLVWVGRRSYSLYLWHYAVTWGDFFRNFGILAPACEVGISLLLAEISYRWIEQPALQFNRSSLPRAGVLAE